MNDVPLDITLIDPMDHFFETQRGIVTAMMLVHMDAIRATMLYSSLDTLSRSSETMNDLTPESKGVGLALTAFSEFFRPSAIELQRTRERCIIAQYEAFHERVKEVVKRELPTATFWTDRTSGIQPLAIAQINIPELQSEYSIRDRLGIFSSTVTYLCRLDIIESYIVRHAEASRGRAGDRVLGRASQ